MAERSSADVQCAVWGGHDIRPHLIGLQIGLTRTTEENSRLGDEYQKMADVGITGYSLNMNGLFDDTQTTGIAAICEATKAEAQTSLVGIAGNVQGRLAIGAADVVSGQYAHEVSKGALTKSNIQASGATIVLPFMSLVSEQQTITADLTHTWLDESALYPGGTSAGGHVIIAVMELDLDGGTDLTIDVEQGDGATGASITGVSTAFTAAGTVYKLGTGTVGEQVRVTATWGGSPGGSATAKILVGWQRA